MTKSLSVHQFRTGMLAQFNNCSEYYGHESLRWLSTVGREGLNWVEIGTFMMCEDSNDVFTNLPENAVNAVWPSKCKTCHGTMD